MHELHQLSTRQLLAIKGPACQNLDLQKVSVTEAKTPKERQKQQQHRLSAEAFPTEEPAKGN